MNSQISSLLQRYVGAYNIGQPDGCKLSGITDELIYGMIEGDYFATDDDFVRNNIASFNDDEIALLEEHVYG